MDLRSRFSLTPARKRLVIQWLGLTILVGGVGMATSIWLAQDQIDRQARAAGTSDLETAEGAGPLAPDDSRRYTHAVKVYYGETGLLLDKWKRGLEGLTQGKALAKTIAVSCLVVASGFFYIAAVCYPRS